MARLFRMPAQVQTEVGQAIRESTLDLLGVAVVAAPVEEGTLRGSGTAHFDGLRVATGSAFGATAAPIAGVAEPLEGGADTGPLAASVVFNAVYAAYQHEGLELRHPKGGRAKYLEAAANANREAYLRDWAEAFKRATGAE